MRPAIAGPHCACSPGTCAPSRLLARPLSSLPLPYLPTCLPIPSPSPPTHQKKQQIVVIEGIYSMEGEMARLAEIVAIKKKYKVGGGGYAFSGRLDRAAA